MEEIPVPIPNTEVKLQCAENTCGLPCWEDRLLPVFFILYNNEKRHKLELTNSLNLIYVFFFYLSSVFIFKKLCSILFPTFKGCILI